MNQLRVMGVAEDTLARLFARRHESDRVWLTCRNLVEDCRVHRRLYGPLYGDGPAGDLGVEAVQADRRRSFGYVRPES